MSDRHARIARRATQFAWLALIVSIACWPFSAAGIGWLITALALLPLLMPVAGIARGSRRTFGWAPLALAPALALTLTEILVNAGARTPTTVSLVLIFVAFAALIASLRQTARD